MNDYLRLLGSLTKADVRFVIVGGTAAVLHGSSTATYDLDILVRFDLESCQKLLVALSGLHPRLAHSTDKRPMSLTAEELAGFKNLYLLTDVGRLDILGSLPPIDAIDEVFRDAVAMQVADCRVRVISLEQLIRVKAAMARPKDRQVEVELRALREAAQGR